MFKIKCKPINPIIKPTPAAENAAHQPILFLKMAQQNCRPMRQY
jgi:hypothetical protein